MKKKAKKKANKNPFRIIIGIILLIKWICFDWIVEWLSIKSYHYLVLINYDKSFELSKELVDAICAYPGINYKPRKYGFITKVYLLITYDEEGTEEGIPVMPVWKWLMEE